MAQHKRHLNDVTEDEVIGLISGVKEFVTNRDIPECKKFIKDYVKRIEVFKDHMKSHSMWLFLCQNTLN